MPYVANCDDSMTKAPQRMKCWPTASSSHQVRTRHDGRRLGHRRPQRRIALLCLAWLCGLAAVSAGAQNIVINEIMYHPASQDVREEFVELLNAGATNVNL